MFVLKCYDDEDNEIIIINDNESKIIIINNNESKIIIINNNESNLFISTAKPIITCLAIVLYPTLIMKFGGGGVYWSQMVRWSICWWNVVSQTPHSFQAI